MTDRVLKWDMRYLRLAREVARWSKDPSTKCGAVIVRPNQTVVSLGFNGFPRGAEDSPEHYRTREVKYSRIVHAEMNACIHAGEDLHGHTLYTWPLLPCDRCAVHIAQWGLQRAVSLRLASELKPRWGESIRRTQRLFDQIGMATMEYERIFDA